jgi:catechol 2,3-dioxygenase-like lactoylglutathione lyase family enzyme
MIRGVHTMFYSSDPEATRAFLRDVLKFPFTDVGRGWLIFDLPEADMGCHPSNPPGAHGPGSPGDPPPGTHDISFYCDDIEKTVAELKAKGVEFTFPVTDRGYGLVTGLRIPGGIMVELYQPKYAKNPKRG